MELGETTFGEERIVKSNKKGKSIMRVRDYREETKQTLRGKGVIMIEGASTELIVASMGYREQIKAVMTAWKPGSFL